MDKKYMLWKIYKRGFQTGSFFFGCKKWEDKDFCILQEDWDKLKIPKEILMTKEDFKLEYDDTEFTSEKIEYKNTIYNFIICKPQRFKAMKIATDTMKKIPLELIENKKDRVEIFVLLREIAQRVVEVP